MSGIMKVQTFAVLLKRILGELQQSGSICGIPRDLFFRPKLHSPYLVRDLFGQTLATPIGPAAGPHTQLAQNIVSAWLSGGRFIELKTVQVIDALEIPRPCIDMEDEGYNVEWSQELKLDQSAQEYVSAWVLIHLLHQVLDFEGPVGTIFNMSVGYNLAGIQTPPMQRFMDRMADASGEIAGMEAACVLHSQIRDFSLPPSRICGSVTLSTMHGCPADEIEQIARYLLEVRGLHTTVKLNPTLLGKDAVMRILHDVLGFREIDIPDAVFEHDLQYDRAVTMIRALKQVAAARGLTFGVKLSNTLAMANHKRALPGDEMYMSGRALYPITVNLFCKLLQEFDGDLNVSYAGGADALNVTTLLACGALPVTAASDLLKPGGYSRMLHWLQVLEGEMQARGAAGLADLARNRLANLERAAADALADPRYRKSFFPFGLPKVRSGLEMLDCIAAPCVEQCAVCQDVPEYAWLISQGEYDRALEVILHRNPLPGITGYVCTHLCQTRCTRNNYDEPVGIRDLKRSAHERGEAGPSLRPAPSGRRVAVIGSGPSGLSAAYFLALSGVQVTILEEREAPGGMPFIAPRFRLPWPVVEADVNRILALGVELKLNHRVDGRPEDLLKLGFDAVYIACGFQRDALPDIEGVDGPGIYPALRLLERVARGERPDLGSRVLVIGGGNTAMDAARTAQRLTVRPATVVYRRTRAEIPAEPEELRDLLDEGNRLVELATPQRVIRENGRLIALECLRNELGDPDADGRRKPTPISGSEFQIVADSIIVAIGQQPDSRFLAEAGIAVREDGAIVTEADGRIPAADSSLPVFAGGDVTRGPETIIAACADGRRAAEAICHQLGIDFRPPPVRPAALTDEDILHVKAARTRQVRRREPESLPAARRTGFGLVEHTLSEEEARAEALRCFQCSTFCDKCVEVCPNRANYAYPTGKVDIMVPVLVCRDGKLEIVEWERFVVAQTRQIIHVDDFCNECGNCATFCVHDGKPYADKPRLFLRRAGFEQETDNAFFVRGDTIWCREKGHESRLTLRGGRIEWNSSQARILLSLSKTGGIWQVEEAMLREPFAGTLSLKLAGQMAVLLRAVAGPLSFLGAGG